MKRKSKSLKILVVLLMTCFIGTLFPPLAQAASLDPPEVETISYDVTEDGVDLIGELYSFGDYSRNAITEHGFFWIIGDNVRVDESRYDGQKRFTTSLREGDEFIHTIRSGLDPNTKYTFVAYLVYRNDNGDNKYEYGSRKTFTTKKNASSLGTITGAANVTSDSQTTIYGSFAYNSSATTYYGFKWGTSRNNLSEKIELGSRKTDEEPFSTTLKGLTKGTTYYYRAYSNRSGSDNEGEIKSFKAGDKSTNVPYVITRDYDYEEDSNEATVYGQVSSRGGSEIIEYGFKWGTSSGSLTRTKTIRGDIAEGRTFSADLTKLASDATYYFQAYAENDNGIGYGAIKEFTIDEYDSGDRPTVNTQTAKVSGNSVTLYGYLNDRGDTSITSYGFYFGKDSDPITRYEVGEYIMDDESFEYTIKNLELGTTYYYKAYARNSAGEEEGKILNIRAGSNVTMVLTTQVNNLGGGGATLLGTIDSGGNSDLTAYGFYWGILNGAETEVKLGSSISVGTTFSYYLTGLETGKTYVARAYARSGNNTYLGNQVTINPSAGGTPIVSGSPVVNIIAPASGTSVSKGAPVAVNATASGSSPIIAMGLYVNGTQKARVDAASINYSVDTSALPAGTNVIRVTGWDGVKAGERVITISVVSGNGTTTPVIPGGSAPTVNIENPSNFEIIKRGNVVEIRASSTPGSKPIEAMALYLYDKRLLRTSGNGFSYFWDTSTVAPGVYEIKVNAWDGSVAGEKIVKVTIQQ